jgi:hypothetical protein
MKTDEEYLDKEFPKGKTKFRGQAMVLLALARKEGQQAEQKRILKITKRLQSTAYRSIADFIEALKKEVEKNEFWR